ncbi:MAG: PKD domain-containing protein [Bacteroidia bacterium]
MRNTLRSLFVLLSVCWCFTVVAQGGPRIAPGGNTVLWSSQTQSINPLARANPLGGNGGGMPLLTASCGPDTVYYPFGKASGLVPLNFSQGVGVGQWYSAPQPITVHGFTFYAWVDSSTNQTVDIICHLYLAGNDSTPTGLPLASDTVTIDSSHTPLTLGTIQQFAHFTPAVTVNAPYVITIENQSLINVAFVVNDYTVGDGQQEWLSSVFIPPAWERSYNIVLGANVFDGDAMLMPHVTYNLTAGFTPQTTTGCTGTAWNWTNTSSPVLFDRFYNIDAFNVFWASFLDSSSHWDYGNGVSEYAIDGAQTYAVPGTYTVTLADTLFGWTTVCVDQTSLTLTIANGAPPVANYANVPSGLSGAFADLTTGSPTSWAWDFGDGGTSTVQNPSHTYLSNGTYTVCLIATNACGTDTICTAITVAGCVSPVANWTSITTGFNVAFTDLSSNGPTTWQWDFGDGGTSTSQNPSHTYLTVATFTVCLIVTNSCGTDTICFPINTGCNSPAAGFTRIPNNLTVAFTDVSTGTPTSWLWDFGDGNTSTLQNPTHTYAASGTYTVCLTATNSCGSNTACTVITVSCPAPQAGFTFTNTGLTLNLTSTSTGSPTTFAWDFGDGATSNIQNPTHVYVQGGTYMVCLTVTSACGTNTLCQNITLNCPLPNTNFSFTSINLAYTFQDLSSGTPTSWSWDFGDGGTSTLQNPSHTYANTGTYQVCLITTNACGNDTSCQAVSVLCPQPAANFSVTQNQLQVNFSDLTTGNPTGWTWVFGDGSPNSIQSNPSHTYAAPGTYQVCLTSVNACGSNTFCMSITVSCPAPNANFNFVTNSNTANFTNQTSGSGSPTYSWDFGDGNTSTATNPSHAYTTVGTFNVCLISTSVCGSDTTCRPVIISCVPPVANFSFITTNDSTVSFTNNASPNSQNWTWTFGDGSPSTTQANPTHVYPAAGTYTACLIVSNSCGFDTICQTVTITCTMPTAGYVAQVTNSVASFNDVSIGAQSWYWTFGDGLSSTLQSPTHTYTQSGIYPVCLTVTNFCGTNTSCQNLVISCNAPQPSWSFQFGTSTVGFTDLSVNSPTTWFWAFGDGSVSTQQNPTHGYLFPGQYYVCLTASNACGSASFCQWINVTVVGETEPDIMEGSLNIFPNPSTGLFNLRAELRKSVDVELRVTNMLGQQVWNASLGKQSGNISSEIDLRGVSQGMYILEVNAGNRRAFKQLIVD